MENPRKQVHHEPAAHKLTKRELVEHNLTYHAPRPEQIPIYEKIRNAAKEFAFLLLENTPDSEEQDTALTELETCVMYANAAIARH